MDNDDDFKQPLQSDNVVGNDMAGRDIYKSTYNQNITVLNLPSANNDQELVDALKKLSAFTEEGIRSVIGQETNGIYDAQRVRSSFAKLKALENSIFSPSAQELNNQYVMMLSGNTMNSRNDQLKHTMGLAGTLAAQLEFDKAHKHLDDALQQVKPTDELYKVIYKEYLISGFIAYSRVNNIDGLKSLLRKKKPIPDAENTEVIYLNIFQEICSRDTDSAISNAVFELNKIYKNAPTERKPAMANSLGLAYRRLGERTGIEDLEMAISVFEEGLQLNKENEILEIELKDQKAITHIRIFELNKDELQLEKAEKLLEQCYKKLKQIQVNDPRNYRLLPRVLNNMGNVHKQRVLCLEDWKSALKAIVFYEEAEEYWTEKDSCYEWALLKKNTADTNYGLSKLTKDASVLPLVIKDCQSAMKYRNLKNSPFQWAKTVDIIFLTIILLDTMNKINLIPITTRRKILSYTKAVYENESKWKSEGIFLNVLRNAEQTKMILQKK